MSRLLQQGWRLLQSALAANRPMRLALAWQLVLLLCGAIVLPFDHRLILGLNPWIKPMKFEISVMVYLFTITLMLHGLRLHRSEADGGGLPRSRHWLGWALRLR